MEPGRRHGRVGGKVGGLARAPPQAGSRVVRHEKGHRERADREGDQRRAGCATDGPGRGEEGDAQHEPKRRHEQQPQPHGLDRHGPSVERRSCDTPGIVKRLVLLAFVVTALLAVVAIAAHGRPLGSGHGRSGGLPATFWDYVFTSFLIVEVLLALLAFVAIFFFRRDPAQRAPHHSRMFRSLAVLLGAAFLLTFVARHVDLHRLLHPGGKNTTTATSASHGANGKNRRGPPPRQAQFRWDELAIVLGVLLGLGVLAASTRKRLEAPTERQRAEMLAAALDESLDDLRTDPDLRRAIIAAYARMESVLAAAGLPRHHAEAPLEYVERALLSLDASADAVRRLTDLFLWARFSQHEPEPSMRDDAVDALVAVRDELRATELIPA